MSNDSDIMASELRRFFLDKLKSEVDRFNEKRRGFFRIGLVVTALVFVILALLARYYLNTLSGTLGQYRDSLWPLSYLTPFAMAVIAFCIVYILQLKSLMQHFLVTAVNRIAEFINPGLVHEVDREGAKAVHADLLFADTVKTEVGSHRIRGNGGGARCEMYELHTVQPDGKTAEGIIFQAEYPRQFRNFSLILPEQAEASLSGIDRKLASAGLPKPGELVRLTLPGSGWQLVTPSGEGAMSANPPAAAARRLDEARRRWGLFPHLLRDGNRLLIAILSNGREVKRDSQLESMDFDRTLAFCRAARMCLELAGDFGEDRQQWEE